MPATVSFDISPSDPAGPVGAEVWFDQQQIFNSEYLTTVEIVRIDLEEDSREHELQVVLKNKLPQHTKIDGAGNIEQDSVILVNNFRFDDIVVDHIVHQQAVYRHNFNGSAALVQDRFYGSMGCNGTLSIKFSTPVYLWLLEHM